MSFVEFLESVCKYYVEATVVTGASAIVGIASQVNPQGLAGAWEAAVAVCVGPRGARADPSTMPIANIHQITRFETFALFGRFDANLRDAARRAPLLVFYLRLIDRGDCSNDDVRRCLF
jgi:hypothetical protein